MMKTIWEKDDSYQDHDKQEGLEEVLDRKSWRRESLKDSELWESLKILGIFGSVKASTKKMTPIYT